MNDLSRRSFLNLMKTSGVFLGASAILGPILAYFYPPELVDVPSEPMLVCSEADLPLGASQTVAFGRYPALVIHTQNGLRAYSAVCTHFACITKWNATDGLIECPCHAGYFNPEDGSVVSGPPPSPLTRLATEVVDGQIYVKVDEQS
jgi:cytochrome b6-f complex iron-sulfur subunit